MKAKKIELDADFIGGQGSLTAQEEKELSQYFQHKAIKNKIVKRVRKTVKEPRMDAQE